MVLLEGLFLEVCWLASPIEAFQSSVERSFSISAEDRESALAWWEK